MLKVFGKESKFTGIDGNIYELKPLSLKQYADFVSWVQYKPYRQALAADLPKDKCNEIFKECQRGKTKELVPPKEWLEENEENAEAICPSELLEEQEFDLELTSTVVLGAMRSIDGIQKLFELSFSIANPDIKLSDVIDLENFVDAQNVLLTENGFVSDSEKDLNESKNEEAPNTMNQ
ncbi:MAG: hypothetical protein GTO02_16570 [Candidatus Dadabacteria bacterium]|nr:hypothetical protein [Candidatus Dadabacteria bacterium]